MLRVILHLQSLVSSQVNSHHRVILILLAELHHLWRPAWKGQHQDSEGSIRVTFSTFLNNSTPITRRLELFSIVFPKIWCSKKKAGKLLEKSVISVIFRQIKMVNRSVCCQLKGNQMHSPAIKLLSSYFSAHFKQGKKLVKFPSSDDCCSWLKVRWTALPWGYNVVCYSNPSTPELSSLPWLGKERAKARTVPQMSSVREEFGLGGVSGGPVLQPSLPCCRASSTLPRIPLLVGRSWDFIYLTSVRKRPTSGQQLLRGLSDQDR